jgi:isopentenyl-diphosphate Delta-isomerase
MEFGLREEVILVNERDEPVGVEEKLETHSRGALHRAFSVFVFNSTGQLLLQKRAGIKYHSKGLWSNTCCGHPRPGEATADAARRRLYEEMGFVCEVRKVFGFIYHVKLDGGLIEHEYDHVLVGNFDGTPDPSREEVADWKWAGLSTLRRDMRLRPDDFTYWFRLCLDPLCEHLLSSDAAPHAGMVTPSPHVGL